ncbi:hypothetical protein [Bordetella pertussis]|nr:hypothetical protein [Bordetella pertussis]
MSEHPFHVLDVPGAPIGEADLHAYADGQLGDRRRAIAGGCWRPGWRSP